MKTRDRVSYGLRTLGRLGISRNVALGGIGSLMGESGRSLNTGAHNPKDPGDGSYGIGQWHSERRRGLERFARRTGRNIDDFRTQMDYVAHELETTHRSVLNAMRNASTMEQGERIWTRQYEVPAAAYRHHDRRLANARYAQQLVAGVNVDEEDPGSLTGAQTVAEKRTPQNPLDVIGGILTGTTQMEDIFGEAGKTIGAAGDLIQGKNPIGAAGTILNQIGAQDPNSPLGAVGSFLTNVTPGMKLGALAGGIIGGPTGSLVGGLIGQTLTAMLGNFQQNAMQGKDFMGNDYFPEKPEGGGADKVKGDGYGGLGTYGKEVYDRSPQFRSAVDTGSVGLW